jgi:hypothetical protein
MPSLVSPIHTPSGLWRTSCECSGTLCDAQTLDAARSKVLEAEVVMRAIKSSTYLKFPLSRPFYVLTQPRRHHFETQALVISRAMR